ncbi:MAG: hypothetical protein E7214_04000 [Clostridium sp.]|nr:hypothetical protein [Clostridium sp.]
MLKLTNKEIVNSIEALKNLSTKELDVKTSFKIAKNIKTIDEISNIFIEEKRKLVNKYGTKDDKGNLKLGDNGVAEIAKENLSEWNRSYEELLEIENNIEIEKIKLSDLDIRVSAQELLAIEYMLEE